MNKPIQYDNYRNLLEAKIEKFKALFNEFDLPSFTVFPSPPSHYRMRAEFRIWHKGDEINHIMYDQVNKRRVMIDDFPIASTLINKGMKVIIPLLKYNHELRYKLFQIDYLSTLSEQLLISLIYHKKLDEKWQHEAQLLRDALIKQGLNVQIVGRASNQKICLDHDYIDEQLTIHGRHYIYRQVENSFTQPNAHTNIDMLSWVIDATKNTATDLLELYCGNGNFSIALAQNFNQVLATEVAKASVKAAHYNLTVNEIKNVKIVRLSAEELTQAMNGERDFNRLEGISLSDYNCHTVLVDPPRSGLDIGTLKMVSRYETIIYISCNPLTLLDNMYHLIHTHSIEQMAVFDQFPYTPHLECGVILRRRS